MKTPYRWIIIPVVLFLQSCSTPSKYPTEVATNFLYRQQVDTITPQIYPSKDPKTVAIYQPDQSPHAPYRIIGLASVSARNLLGVKRQQATLDTMIKKLAASIGGDGVIEVSQNSNGMNAKVIAFQKILI